MNVLVTGSSGFIGKAVCQELHDAGHDVHSFDLRDGFDITYGRQCINAVEGMDAVIHLAGVLGTDELFDDVTNAIDINIKGTVNILAACAGTDAHFIGITMPPVFPSIYTATKVAAARFATAYHHNYNLPVTHIRAFNVFGPGQKHGEGHPRKIIPAFATEAWKGVPLRVWGDGNQTVDLIHVTDVARIFARALEYAPGNDETIDAGTGKAFTVNEVADMVIDFTVSDSEIHHLPMRRGEIPTQLVASGEGWEYLDFTPKFDPFDLLKTVISYRP